MNECSREFYLLSVFYLNTIINSVYRKWVYLSSIKFVRSVYCVHFIKLYDIMAWVPKKTVRIVHWTMFNIPSIGISLTEEGYQISVYWMLTSLHKQVVKSMVVTNKMCILFVFTWFSNITDKFSIVVFFSGLRRSRTIVCVRHWLVCI